jgi:hypothetical protein
MMSITTSSSISVNARRRVPGRFAPRHFSIVADEFMGRSFPRVWQNIQTTLFEIAPCAQHPPRLPSGAFDRLCTGAPSQSSSGEKQNLFQSRAMPQGQVGRDMCELQGARVTIGADNSSPMTMKDSPRAAAGAMWRHGNRRSAVEPGGMPRRPVSRTEK